MSYGNYGQPPPPGGYGGYSYGQQPPAGGYGYQQQPNPYAPPQQPFVPYAGGGNIPVPGAAMKWLYMGGFLGTFLFLVGGGILIGALGSDSDGANAVSALLPISLLFLLLVPIAACVWLYKSWNAVPPQMRYTDGGKWVSPGAAVGFIFVPVYGWYWMFVANAGLCDAINRTLVAAGGQPRAPKGLAIACCVIALIPYVNYLSPITWTIYMFAMDSAKRELVNRTGVAAY